MEKTKEEIEDQMKRISEEVERRLVEFGPGCGIMRFVAVKESHDHIIQIGTSILCTKWGVGYTGGDFVKAVVDNDLMGAFGRADYINRQCIEFYCKLIYNTPYIN